MTDLPGRPAGLLVLAPPALALAVFGTRVPLASRYAEWLAGDGVERGLIGPRETTRLWERHLLNCAAIAALIPPGSHVVDMGSGAGLPGVVLAIARPDLHITLVEPMLRRTAFLQGVVADLGLDGIDIQRARAEELARVRLSADVVTARAVARVDRLAALAAPLLRLGGELLAIKGVGVYEELAVGWPAVQRADMTLSAAVFSIDAAGAGRQSPGGERPKSYQAGLEVTCVSTGNGEGTRPGPPARVVESARSGSDPVATVATVLRLGHGSAQHPDAGAGKRQAASGSQRVPNKGSRGGGQVV